MIVITTYQCDNETNVNSGLVEQCLLSLLQGMLPGWVPLIFIAGVGY